MSEELEKNLEGLRQSAGKLGIKPPDAKSPKERALSIKNDRLERHGQVTHVSGPQTPTMDQAKRTWNG